MSRPVAIATLAGALCLVGAACSQPAPAAGPPSPPTSPPGTLALDGLPEPLTGGSLPSVPTAPDDTVPPTDPVTVPPTAPAIGTEPGDPPIEPGTVGAFVGGPHVLVIGDSILASTAPRFGGLLCQVLNDSFGWSVEIHAETGQAIEFGELVLDDRLDPPGLARFDVVAVMLGNNYRGNYDDYTVALEALLERLAPRPTVLFTLTETTPDHTRINEYIRWRPYFHPNVLVIDWAQLTAAEPDTLLAGDGLHPTDEGRGRLVLFTAAALGPAPDTIGRPTCVEHVL
jgi:hypothetical protein